MRHSGIEVVGDGDLRVKPVDMALLRRLLREAPSRAGRAVIPEV